MGGKATGFVRICQVMGPSRLLHHPAGVNISSTGRFSSFWLPLMGPCPCATGGVIADDDRDQQPDSLSFALLARTSQPMMHAQPLRYATPAHAGSRAGENGSFVACQRLPAAGRAHGAGSRAAGCRLASPCPWEVFLSDFRWCGRRENRTTSRITRRVSVRVRVRARLVLVRPLAGCPI